MTVNDQIIQEINEYARIKLSPEGERILRAVLTRGFVTARDLYQQEVPSISSHSSLYRAVRRLVKRKLLEPLRMSDVGVLGWRLSRDLQTRFCTEAGLSGSGQYRLIATKDLHDRAVRKAAAALEREYHPHFIAHEGAVRTHMLATKVVDFGDVKNGVPDFVMGAKNSKGQVLKTAFDIELSQKGKRRLSAVFDKKLSCREWSNCVYLLGRETNEEAHLASALFAVRTSPRISRQFPYNPVLFIRVEEFLANGLCATGVRFGRKQMLGNFLLETGTPGSFDEAGR